MKLFEPGMIGNMELKNRIIMAPMGGYGLCELDGRYSERAIDYYAARAKGGAGLITTGVVRCNLTVETSLVDGIWSGSPRIDNRIYVPRLNELAYAMHQYGAKLSVQITAGLGRNAGVSRTARPVGPSEIPCFWDPKVNTRALTVEEIEELVKSFGAAAKYARMAEIDAIEIHGHEGYLIDEFMTSLWNKREDKYGGDLDGRLRFPMEIISEIKNSIGSDLALIFRFGARHFLEGGRELEESREIARRLEAAGVDALHVDDGCYDTWYWAHPPTYHTPGCSIDAIAAIKKVVNIPVIAVGKLGNPKLANEVLETGKADFIALGRPLLADPDWPSKVKRGEFEDIRPCIGGHDACMQRILTVQTISCAVNPQVGRERDYQLTKAEHPRQVLIIGGGPGGLEAARVAAICGHQVTLWEKEDRLGGNLLPASVPDFKQDIRDLINYLTTQINKLGVNVVLGKEATKESIIKERPEVVILATGATPLVPKIPGVSNKNVCTAIDLFMGRASVGERLIICGGGIVGCEMAVYQAQQGKKVTIVEMVGELLQEKMYLANKMMLLKMLKDSGVTSLTSAKVMEVNEKGVVVNNDGHSAEITGDSVVLALGLKSGSKLKESLQGSNFDIYTIGDCVEPRSVMTAMWEGFHTARLLN